MIKLTKVSINPDSKATQSETIEDYRSSLGDLNSDKSPPVDYWVLGELINKPTVGESLVINRTNRNGVDVRGVMYTSPILDILKNTTTTLLTTQNSVYILEEVE